MFYGRLDWKIFYTQIYERKGIKKRNEILKSFEFRREQFLEFNHSDQLDKSRYSQTNVQRKGKLKTQKYSKMSSQVD